VGLHYQQPLFAIGLVNICEDLNTTSPLLTFVDQFPDQSWICDKRGVYKGKKSLTAFWANRIGFEFKLNVLHIPEWVAMFARTVTGSQRTPHEIDTVVGHSTDRTPS
jgi:hypothetical protein